MATLSINASTEDRRTTLRARLRVVPWLTVVPLAVVMAYGDVFWLVGLRGSVGAIERTQEPFAAWLRESTLSLPFFVVAVILALAVAAHRFGPVVSKLKNVVAAVLMVVTAGTLVGVYEVATSSAYDYHLQSAQVQQRGSMGSMATSGTTAAQQQASFRLQVRAVALGSGILLVTNLALVSWVVALRGGRLTVRATRA